MIWTIGHSTRAVEELIEALAAHRIAWLIDVRTVPKSRHNPQFNRDTLPGTLAGASIAYRHEPRLGGLRKPAADSINSGWRNAGFRGYADHMQSEAFEAALDELIELSATNRIVVMCAEAVPWRCHRMLIGDAMNARGHEVHHILSGSKSEAHRLTPFARVDDGRVIYPGAAVSVPAVAALLREANRILFITGAGMSADSGLPTYRGVGGLYRGRPTEEGIAIEDALSGQMLATRPELTWKYLWELGSACRDAKPNRGHEVIAEIEKRKPGTWVLTQNVDGLHRAAGSRNLIEIHGRSDALFCVGCARKTTPDEFLSGLEAGQAPPLPPTCSDCGGLIRPDVVLFGEMLQEAALRQYYALAGMGIEIVLSIGTTSVFPYIAEPVRQARASGVPTVEINPARTEISDVVDYRLETGAADALGEIGRELRL